MVPAVIDPVVMEAIGATGGNLYKHLIGALPRYPIPSLRIEAPAGASFLDIGCHWAVGASAPRAGFRVIGLDPYLPAVRAARRVARASASRPPSSSATRDSCRSGTRPLTSWHSYSVLQHFSETDVRTCAVAVGGC